MSNLQLQVQGFLDSNDYDLRDSREGFVCAVRYRYFGDMDYVFVWILPELIDPHNNLGGKIEKDILEDCRSTKLNYPKASLYVIADDLTILSSAFHKEASKLSVLIQAPIQFFDNAYTYKNDLEYSQGRNHTIIVSLCKKISRVPQPYLRLYENNIVSRGEDLLDELLKKFEPPFITKPSLDIGMCQ